MTNIFETSPRLQPLILDIIRTAEKELMDIMRVPVKLDMQVMDKVLNHLYIKELVCHQFGIAPELLEKKCRKEHLVAARQIHCYLCSQYCKMNYGEIGATIKRDRTTAMHGEATIKGYIKVNDSYIQLNLQPILAQLNKLNDEKIQVETKPGDDAGAC